MSQTMEALRMLNVAFESHDGAHVRQAIITDTDYRLIFEALMEGPRFAKREAEALALLRELNDALKIPGWLQPRVDAVLDRAQEPPSALDTPFLTAGGDPAEPKPDHNRIAAICELDGCCMLRDKTGPAEKT